MVASRLQTAILFPVMPVFHKKRVMLEPIPIHKKWVGSADAWLHSLDDILKQAAPLLQNAPQERLQRNPAPNLFLTASMPPQGVLQINPVLRSQYIACPGSTNQKRGLLDV